MNDLMAGLKKTMGRQDKPAKLKGTCLDLFQKKWEEEGFISKIPTWKIKEIMADAKPHTQVANGLETMAWLHDRLMIELVERGE